MYLTVDELAKYLRIAPQTSRRWVLNREVPFHKIGRAVRFRASEIDAWIDAGAGKPWKKPRRLLSLDALGKAGLAPEETLEIRDAEEWER